MGKTNKSYRIRTNVGADSFIPLDIEREYDTLDILSLKINSKDTYKLHNANVGVIVGRVQANNGFGIPNAKVSVFINANTVESSILRELYPFVSPASKDGDGIRYNLLPDEKTGDCHQIVGTFPSKRYMLDNDIVLEVFDTFYKYTTKTNNSGDYLLTGIPTGEQTLHVDIDLSDCGILSQRPRDFVYKGYTIEQFENPNMFKSGTNYGNLSQVFTQNKSTYVYPYWGNESIGEEIGLTRVDFDIAYQFEPTCIFIGSVISDNASQGITKRCVPTENMGNMDELVAGKGTIEMIRKTVGGDVEEFQVKGTELINGDGIWCYQIPMNLDYMMTDEYGNLVPTDDPSKGIPTRTRVRFRVSMEDMEDNTNNFFRAKILVPHNPQNLSDSKHEDYDYEFGTYTRDESFRDLFWNNVYTVKSYFPRIQKRKLQAWKTKKFTGIKGCQSFGSNNPMPYNNIRIRLPLMFRVLCILIKVFIKITAIYNTLVAWLGAQLAKVAKALYVSWIFQNAGENLYAAVRKFRLNVIEDGLCPDLENWYFAPMTRNTITTLSVPTDLSGDNTDTYDIMQLTIDSLRDEGGDLPLSDSTSIDYQNQDNNDDSICITTSTDYLISCMEMNLAQEYKVINFDFYNDWINGVLYFPRWMRDVRIKRSFHGTTFVETKIKSCMDDTKTFSKARRYTQMCSLGYARQTSGNHALYSKVRVNLSNKTQINANNKYHKKRGTVQTKIFGKNGGICHESTTMVGQHVYYLKPCEWSRSSSPSEIKINLFATDLVLLGSVNDCDLFGIPQSFTHLPGTSYIMPPNIAMTNLETDSTVYTTQDGYICSSSHQTTSSSNLSSVSGIDGTTNNVLTSELQANTGASDGDDISFDNDEADTIALTEIAGISWNYIGPGQGRNVENKLYYPGGHFLGLSCSNAQTNVKSCVNLERICEVGAAMSQRKDDIRTIDQNGNPRYIYTVPSGLIAGGDIVDLDFRSMFATMNQKRLIANRLNPDTGYLTYTFQYLRPNNFNGELSEYGQSLPYNKLVNVTDESSTLAMFDIADSSTVYDTDSEEVSHTQTRTIEEASIDYYRFKFGLEYDDLTATSLKHLRKFGYSKNNSYYLPQYENSFYFYFGLKAGATAIDEFNKEFFAECETSQIVNYDHGFDLIIDDFNVCGGYSDVTIRTLNLTPEFLYNIVNEDTEAVITGLTSDVEFSIQLQYGTYTITIKDGENFVTTRRCVVGEELNLGSINVQNFTFNVPIDGFIRNPDNQTSFFGGFIEINNATISSAVTFTTKKLILSEGPQQTQNMTSNIDANGHSRYYFRYANRTYNVYIEYVCDGLQSTPVRIYLGQYTINDNSNMHLKIGTPLTMNLDTFTSASTAGWWLRDYWSSPNSDTPEKLSVRHSIINSAGNETPFSNNVRPYNGDKILFGSLQNYDSIYEAPNRKLFNSYFIDDWQAGYVLDDEASYHATYGKLYTPNIHQYHACTIGDGVVLGTWVAKFSGETGITKSLIMVPNPPKPMLDNEGCVIKSMTNEYIIGGIYHADTQTVECMCDASQAAEIRDGIVYPTYFYPVINRTFKVSANYFFFSSKVMNASHKVVQKDMYEILEARIFNGLTFQGYYSGKSYMRTAIGFMNEEMEGLVENDLAVFRYKYTIGYSDFNRNTRDIPTGQTNTPDTYLNISGFTQYAEANLQRGYDIIEGFPLTYIGSGTNRIFFHRYFNSPFNTEYENAAMFESVSEHRQLSMDAIFCDNISVVKDDTNNTVTFYNDGLGDSDIEYYYANPNDYPINQFVDPNHYVYQRENTDNFNKFHVACVYVDNPNGDSDHFGETFAVKVRCSDVVQHRYRGKVTVYLEDGTEDEVGFLIDLNHAFSESDFQTLENHIHAETSGLVKCVKTIFPKVFGKYQSSVGSYTMGVLPSFSPNNKITFGVPQPKPSFTHYVVIGIKRYNNNSLALGNVCKFYEEPNDITPA